jgi:hypothetical protein
MADVTKDILFLVQNDLQYVEFYARHKSKRGAQWRSAASIHIAGATVKGSNIESSF